MAKKKKLETSLPSKAYLVSFGDTMTALLAFFIVLNSLAQEQTGAAMYAGTGSFALAFSKSGSSGGKPGDRSKDMINQRAQKPIYALAENMEDDDGDIGPDDTSANDRILDREKESFQKFLDEVNEEYGLKQLPTRTNQIVWDAFDPLRDKDGEFTKQAERLLSQAFGRIRKKAAVDIILWARLPSGKAMKVQLENSLEVKKKVLKHFRLNPSQDWRLRFQVKPWLFADAKRPKYSVVISGVEI